MALADLLIEPCAVDAILGKFVTKNDDSGRHGVLIPNPAYSLFPAIPKFDSKSGLNYTVPITTLWRTPDGAKQKSSNYKHYHRYPERRITALRSQELDGAPKGSLILIGRRRAAIPTYELVFLAPSHPSYSAAVSELGFTAPVPGLYSVLKDWNPSKAAAGYSTAIARLIGRFDALSAERFVPSLRHGGSRGVGNTFEIRMGGDENNRAEADVDGVELKSMLKHEYEAGPTGDADLFLKEPKWIDGIATGSARLTEYGYSDENDRTALYSGVKARKNSHGFALKVNRLESRLELVRDGAVVGFWSFADLSKSLTYKLKDTLYALADAKTIDGVEHFFYHTLIYCGQPSVEGMMRLVESGSISLQIRMHLKETGWLRNHGCQFRVSMGRWAELFGVVRAIRQVARTVEN